MELSRLVSGSSKKVADRMAGGTPAPGVIRTALGPTVAERIIVDAQFGLPPDTSFAAAARQTIATSQSLYCTSQAVVQKAFAGRGIL